MSVAPSRAYGAQGSRRPHWYWYDDGMSILVTGGAGYIGSHTTLALLRAGYNVVVVDDLSNSSVKSVQRVSQLAGRAVDFHELDLRDSHRLREVFKASHIEAVIHFAGSKSVAESVANPGKYYDNNVYSSVVLTRAMADHDVRTLIFSSSATVYGRSDNPRYVETMPTAPFNPYGRTKLIVEHLLQDLVSSDSAWSMTALRYFNPIGADESGEIGEDPLGVPNNLFPYIAQVAIGQRPHVTVFGADYPTSDGTGERDYIHVSDLADGHVAALKNVSLRPNTLAVYNLGNGHGSSVLEVIHAFERATGQPVPYNIAGRRPGDLPAYWADASRAREVLGWTAQRDLATACADTWRWQVHNPSGFRR